jgi:single stranded DNA-binding protein
VVPNTSSAGPSSRIEVGKQFTFTKEEKRVAPSGGYQRGPYTQGAPARPAQSAAGPTPSAASETNAQPRNGDAFGQKPNKKVTLTGRLGRAAVVRQTKNGHVVANFSVAVDESYKDLVGELHKKTAWHRVQVWDELAETVSAGLQKGVRVYIEGRRAFRNWIDRENRQHCYTEIVASDVRFLDPAPTSNAQIGAAFTEVSAAA